MLRLNWLGVSRCKLLKSTDSISMSRTSTPSMIDIKPWFDEMGPRGPIRQPAWVSEMLTDYFAPQQESR